MKIEVGKENIIIYDFNEIEALKIAIRIEDDGFKIYKKLAEKVENERLKKTFLRLAEDEGNHLRLFSSIYESELKNKGINPDDVDTDESLFNYADIEIFRGLEDLSKVKTVNDIIKLGIEVEMKTILFYTEVYGKTENTQGKREIKKIIEEEKIHYNILKSWEGIS